MEAKPASVGLTAKKRGKVNGKLDNGSKSQIVVANANVAESVLRDDANVVGREEKGSKKVEDVMSDKTVLAALFTTLSIHLPTHMQSTDRTQNASISSLPLPLTALREKYIARVEAMADAEVYGLGYALQKKEEQFKHIAQFTAPQDIHHVLDLCIPLLQSYIAESKVFADANDLLSATTTILTFLSATLRHSLTNQSDTFNRLASCREYSTLISLLAAESENQMRKVPGIARVLRGFMEGLGGGEWVRVLVAIKSYINRPHPQQYQSPTPPAPNTFIHFLCALSLSSSSSSSPLPTQVQTLLLNECLTSLNSHTPTTTSRLLSSTHLDPSITEVSAALLILSTLMPTPNFPVSVLGSMVPTFARVVFHERCCVELQKAFVAVVGAVLEVGGGRGEGEEGRGGWKDIVESVGLSSAVGVLKWFGGDGLRVATLLLSPLLKSYPPLCTAFTTGLLSLDTATRRRLITPSPLEKEYIDWELPFAPGLEELRIAETWWSGGVMMGLVKLTHTSQTPLTYPQLELLYTISQQCMEDKEVLDMVKGGWMYLSRHVIACMAEPHQVELACGVVDLVGRCCDGVDDKTFPTILSTLLYAYASKRGQCVEAVLRLLRYWANGVGSGERTTSDQIDRCGDGAREVLEVWEGEIEGFLRRDGGAGGGNGPSGRGSPFVQVFGKGRGVVA
ncbi:hypothetical protein HK097_006673 [Rhizophlyctis rosea]|uniref:Uncharacterized protein n=1 Tax=Rhizophlyctis rosea TaxID=64517 RepID=A0AAD5X5N8_9FUNG|nr:hypothetical protein HK097_006673 [Rhizophlyctis rosea]